MSSSLHLKDQADHEPSLGATTPSINTRVEAHADSDTMVVIIAVNISAVFRGRTEGATEKKALQTRIMETLLTIIAFIFWGGLFCAYCISELKK